MNAVWGPEGSGPPPEDKMIKMVNNKVESLKNNLKKNYFYFMFTKYYDSFYTMKKGLKLLKGIINIMKQPLFDEEKINELVSIGLLSQSAEQRNRVFVSHYSNNSQLEKRIRSLEESLQKE